MALNGAILNLGLSLLPTTFCAAALCFLTKVNIEQHNDEHGCALGTNTPLFAAFQYSLTVWHT